MTYDFDELTSAAYHTERVRARRLVASAALSEEQALRQTLEQAAGAAGLPALLAARRQSRRDALERRAAKAQAKTALRLAKTHDSDAAANAWRGWFDGSAHPNPGRIGIGAVLTGPAGQRIEISRAGGHGNSSEAEYLALIALLEAAVMERPAQLWLYGDSQVVVHDVNRATKAGAKGLDRLRARADALLADCADVTLRWIPRHRNGAADALSQQAVAAWHGNEHQDS